MEGREGILAGGLPADWRQLAQGRTDEELHRLLNWTRLEALHRAYDRAAGDIVARTGQPICAERCGWCCQRASVFALGIEAEYAVSVLLGNPDLIKPTLDRIRGWLTARGRYSYGRSITREWLEEHWGEIRQIGAERCCLLGDDLRCTIYAARPLACRAYGVTHLPNPQCQRPMGMGEASDRRVIITDPDGPGNPLRPMFNAFRGGLVHHRHAREGFFAAMIFEYLAAAELAGLVDDGKVPVLKVANGIGDRLFMLWQEEMDREWAAAAAESSIQNQVPLAERDGEVFQLIDSAGRR